MQDKTDFKVTVMMGLSKMRLLCTRAPPSKTQFEPEPLSPPLADNEDKGSQNGGGTMDVPMNPNHDRQSGLAVETCGGGDVQVETLELILLEDELGRIV